MSDLQTYRDMLRINKHRLDDELEIQADVLERISEQVARLSTSHNEAVEVFKRSEASAFIDHKQAGEADKLADANSKRDPQRMKAWAEVQRAREELDVWRDLYEAWKARGYSLKELTSLYVAQYFSVNPNHNVDRRERPQNVPPRRDFAAEREQERQRLAARIYSDPPTPRTRRRAG